MPKSAVQLTFPCPACGGYLSLSTLHATGPCPTCKAPLEVHLSVHQKVPQVQRVLCDVSLQSQSAVNDHGRTDDQET